MRKIESKESKERIGNNMRMIWVWPLPRMPVANKGLDWDSLLKKGITVEKGHCYWEGAIPNI